MSLSVNGTVIPSAKIITVNGTNIKKITVNGKIVWGYTASSDFRFDTKKPSYQGIYNTLHNETRYFWNNIKVGYIQGKVTVYTPYEVAGHLYVLAPSSEANRYKIAKLS